MKASETSIRNLLEGTKQFQVPLFQRPYSWNKDYWDALWNDLMSIYKGEIEGFYFLGPIVTQAVSGTADGISAFLIIDGQQRLTTLSILLATLRDKLRQDNNDLAEELHEYYLINKFKNNDDFFKILPTKTDRESYRSIIKNNGQDNNSKGKINDAYEHFTKKLEEKSLKNLSFCEKLKSIILEKLIIVNITSDEKDNPYLIFESLNNKGQELTQADLVRNYIFMKLPIDNREEQYNQLWRPLEDKFKTEVGDKYSEELTNAFWFYLRKDGKSVQQKYVYQSLKKRFDQNQNNLLEELQLLVKFSNYYQRFNFPQKEESNSKFKEYFNNLLRLDFKTSHIFLLNIYNDYENGKISEQDFEKILLYLESYFVRRLFSRVSTQSLGGIINNLYAEIKKAESSSIVDGLYKTLNKFDKNKRWPSDKEFKTKLVNQTIYKGTKNDRNKFLLERLEKYQGKEIVDFSTLTIEHIMPQKIKDEWKKKLGDDHSSNHTKWLHTLGNLTLTAYNSELSNKSYSEKLEYLKKSNLYLNHDFREIDKWNFETIQDRANRLADIAIKVWPRQQC
ncbi:DUF262 domain-containing HNH endonuclease family protein [Crocosphaera sp. XPORK-15E]|uniref:DUF262 domain-containing protein n=1 Tax=Crocosphaera sp. XPORK-15E TaxID=3110247 RepID=UPI002B21FFDB|nr:DUF262 domain-containing HNH endonuclease family protein [Crocosphaera sp. XPORK-15E]MEA5533345.1 DUF262 domain-containing HNH endonuclease family protein [Crocosphaera sp. XPORK-15E]